MYILFCVPTSEYSKHVLEDETSGATMLKFICCYLCAVKTPTSDAATRGAASHRSTTRLPKASSIPSLKVTDNGGVGGAVNAAPPPSSRAPPLPPPRGKGGARVAAGRGNGSNGAIKTALLPPQTPLPAAAEEVLVSISQVTPRVQAGTVGASSSAAPGPSCYADALKQQKPKDKVAHWLDQSSNLCSKTPFSQSDSMINHIASQDDKLILPSTGPPLDCLLMSPPVAIPTLKPSKSKLPTSETYVDDKEADHESISQASTILFDIKSVSNVSLKADSDTTSLNNTDDGDDDDICLPDISLPVLEDGAMTLGATSGKGVGQTGKKTLGKSTNIVNISVHDSSLSTEMVATVVLHKNRIVLDSPSSGTVNENVCKSGKHGRSSSPELDNNIDTGNCRAVRSPTPKKLKNDPFHDSEEPFIGFTDDNQGNVFSTSKAEMENQAESCLLPSCEAMPPPAPPGDDLLQDEGEQHQYKQAKVLCKRSETAALSISTRSNTRFASQLKKQMSEPHKIVAASVEVKNTKSPGWSHVACAKKDLRTRHIALNITGGVCKLKVTKLPDEDMINTGAGNNSLIAERDKKIVSSCESSVVIDDQTQKIDTDHLELAPERYMQIDELKTIVTQSSQESNKKSCDEQEKGNASDISGGLNILPNIIDSKNGFAGLISERDQEECSILTCVVPETQEGSGNVDNLVKNMNAEVLPSVTTLSANVGGNPRIIGADSIKQIPKLKPIRKSFSMTTTNADDINDPTLGVSPIAPDALIDSKLVDYPNSSVQESDCNTSAVSISDSDNTRHTRVTRSLRSGSSLRFSTRTTNTMKTGTGAAPSISRDSSVSSQGANSSNSVTSQLMIGKNSPHIQQKNACKSEQTSTNIAVINSDDGCVRSNKYLGLHLERITTDNIQTTDDEVSSTVSQLNVCNEKHDKSKKQLTEPGEKGERKEEQIALHCESVITVPSTATAYCATQATTQFTGLGSRNTSTGISTHSSELQCNLLPRPLRDIPQRRVAASCSLSDDAQPYEDRIIIPTKYKNKGVQVGPLPSYRDAGVQCHGPRVC